MKATVIFEIDYPDELSDVVSSVFHPHGVAAAILAYGRELSTRYATSITVGSMRALTTEEYERLTAELEARP